jgi:EAL and modified HD-GYP domain-containing signal transduction protein
MNQSTYFVGRQPILDVGQHCHGYELLFRHHAHADSAKMCSPEKASAQVLLDTVLDTGLSIITEGQLAFVNITPEFLFEGDTGPCPTEQLVFEVPSEMLLQEDSAIAIRRLRSQGYRFAADGFHFQTDPEALLPLVDLLKVDMRLSPEEAIRKLPFARQDRPTLLAEKVETQDVFERCRDQGFDLFQGFFFCKPVVVEGRRLPPGSVTVMRLLEILMDPMVKVRDLEQLIEEDIALSYKLLRFINSPHFGFRHQIHSVQQAIVFAGLDTVRNLVSLVSLSQIHGKPGELVRMALIRARTCELLGRQEKARDTGSYFTVGMFSLLDSLLDRPMEEVLQQLPLSEEVNAAILEHRGDLGRALDCSQAFERGDWVALSVGGFDLLQAQKAYLDAVRWAGEIHGEPAAPTPR